MKKTFLQNNHTLIEDIVIGLFLTILPLIIVMKMVKYEDWKVMVTPNTTKNDVYYFLAMIISWIMATISINQISFHFMKNRFLRWGLSFIIPPAPLIVIYMFFIMAATFSMV